MIGTQAITPNGVASVLPAPTDRSHPSPQETAEVLVSVVIPLADSRGHAQACVKSYARDQTLPRDQYEVIVVAESDVANTDPRIKSLLTKRDKLVQGGSSCPAHLYNVGARHATGKFLFLTESHVLAESDCLAEIMQSCRMNNWVAACCQSDSLNQDSFALMVERIFREDLDRRLRSHHLGKVSVRGFAVDRDLFARVGAFNPELDHFSEVALGMELAKRGIQIGFAKRSRVLHVNERSTSQIAPNLVAYGKVECLFRQRNGPESEHEFGMCDVWQSREFYRRESARAVWGDVVRDIPRAAVSDIFGRMLFSHLGFLRKNGVTALWGPKGELLKSRLALLLAQMRESLCRFSRERRYRAFCQIWQHLIRHGQLQFVERHLQAEEPATFPTNYEYDLSQVESHRLFGFYEVEEIRGQPFRWTQPVAQVSVTVPPGRYRLTVHSLPIRPKRPRAAFCVLLDGHRLRRTNSGNSEVEFEVDESQFEADRNSHRLLLLVNPFRPSRYRSTDRRTLGLPIREIRFTTANV